MLAWGETCTMQYSFSNDVCNSIWKKFYDTFAPFKKWRRGGGGEEEEMKKKKKKEKEKEKKKKKKRRRTRSLDQRP